jgi:hypothetical protein
MHFVILFLKPGVHSLLNLSQWSTVLVRADLARIFVDSQIYDIVAARKKVGTARCEYGFDVQHTSNASKRLKVVLLHLWRTNVKTTCGFLNIPVEDFHLKPRHNNITTVHCTTMNHRM